MFEFNMYILGYSKNDYNAGFKLISLSEIKINFSNKIS